MRITTIIIRHMAVLIALSFLAQGCMKEGDSTILLPPTLTQIPQSVLGKDLVDSLSQYMHIYEGDEAPNVQGKYVCSPMQMVYSTDNYPNPKFYDIYVSFEGQNCRDMITYVEKQNTAHFKCSTAYVIGRKKKFTISMAQRMTSEANGWWCDVAIVISGEMTTMGIEDLEYAIVMKDKYDPYEVLMEKNDFRVYRDMDGLASCHDWNSQDVPDNSDGAMIAFEGLGKGGCK